MRLRPLILASITLTTAVIALPSYSQRYPSHPVRIIVPNAPASSGDIVARLIAPQLSERLGQPVVVDNRAGAGTMIGGEAVAKSPPDGYTLLTRIIHEPRRVADTLSSIFIVFMNNAG